MNDRFDFIVGDDSIIGVNRPVQIWDDVIAVSSPLVLRSDGSLWSWDSHGYGAVAAEGSTDFNFEPIDIPIVSSYRAETVWVDIAGVLSMPDP